MKDLKEIVSTLSAYEVKFVQQFYLAGDNLSQEQSKRLKLFDMLCESEFDANKCCIQIYGDINRMQAFKKLKLRLKGDLLNIKLIKSGQAREGEINYQQTEIECRRMLLQGDMLLKSGAISIGQKLLERAYKMAVKNEFLAEALLAAEVLRTHIGFKRGIREFEEYTLLIHAHLESYQKVLEAKEINYRILLPHIFQKNLGDEYLEYTSNARQKMQESFEQTNSPNIGYVYYLTNLYYYDLIKDLDTSLENGHAFLKHIQDNPAICSNNRVANAHIQLANILINQRQFNAAAIHAESAVGLFKDSGNNQLVALELLFLAQFHAKALEESNETVLRVVGDRRARRSDFVKGKWAYYESAVRFHEGKFDASLAALQKESALLRDKSGWLFGHKLLEIMNLIELGSFDLVEFRVEALRKLLQRQKNGNVLRVKHIFQLLSSLVRKEFNFVNLIESGESDENGSELLKPLRSNDPGYSWDPTGFELIRFDHWLQRKTAA